MNQRPIYLMLIDDSHLLLSDIPKHIFRDHNPLFAYTFSLLALHLLDIFLILMVPDR